MTRSAGSFTGSDCCPIFAPLLATMGHQPSLPQPAPSVSQALTPDTREFFERHGHAAAAVLIEQSEIAAGLGDTESAQSWRDIAQATQRLIRAHPSRADQAARRTRKMARPMVRRAA
jgi:hypothetical protein